jgi:hypothetical protein
MVPEQLLRRMIGKFTVGDDCWEWTAAMTYGYGAIGAGSGSRRTLKAHRVMWEWFNGPIPEGLHILHRCDNRRCVRPDHLYPGTDADNVRDMWERGRAVIWQRGRDHCFRGHPWDYVAPDGERGCRTCRAEATRRSQERRRDVG